MSSEVPQRPSPPTCFLSKLGHGGGMGETRLHGFQGSLTGHLQMSLWVLWQLLGLPLCCFLKYAALFL